MADLTLLFLLILIVILIICAVFLQIKLSASQERERTKSLLQSRQAAYYARQHEIILQHQKETSRQRHELKNEYLYLQTLAEQGDTKELLDYLRDRTAKIDSVSQIKTGNLLVDGVLGYHLRTAAAVKTRIHTDLSIPTQMDVNQAILSGVLGNLLDNAIEACTRLPEEERLVDFLMRVEKQNLFIEISNPFDGYLKLKKGRPVTRKPNKNHHGFGLDTVRRLLDGGNGSMDISWDEHHFTVEVVMYHAL